MKFSPTYPTIAGMTLIETLIGAAIGSAVIGAMVFGSVSFQQLSNGADEYYKATSDQMRVLDSIALDARRATSGSVSNSGQTLTLNLPDYIDYSQNPPVPRTPTISAAGTVTYGALGSQPTVVYTVTGSVPNQTITRTLTSAAGVATTSILTWDTSNNQFLCFDPANPSSTSPFSFGNAGEPSSIMAQVTFQPRFNRINLSSSRAGTRAAMRMYLRNHQ
jgi:Tfp pilus assembly protein PilW